VTKPKIQRFNERRLTFDPMEYGDRVNAGDAVRAFERSPAYLRLSQLLESTRQRQHDQLYRNPVGVDRDEYVFASGVVSMIDDVYKFFDKILEEAGSARESAR